MTTWLIFPCSQNGFAVIYSLTDWYIVIALKFNLGFIILNLTTHSPSQINVCFFPYYYFTLEALYKSHIEYTSLSELQNLTFSQLIKRTKLKSVCIPDIQIRFFQYALFNGNYFNPTNISIHSCHMSNLELTEQWYVSVHNNSESTRHRRSYSQPLEIPACLLWFTEYPILSKPIYFKYLSQETYLYS